MAKRSANDQRLLLEVLRRAAGDRELLEAFLDDLLTPAERRELAARWQIVRRLARGEAHRAVAQELGVGLATVARGARMLARRDGGFRRLLRLGRPRA